MIYELSFEGYTVGYFPTEAEAVPFPFSDRVPAFREVTRPADGFGLGGEIPHRIPFKG